MLRMRNSNFELLRIVAMILIILHHNMLYFGDLRYPNMEQYINQGTNVYIDSLLNSIGVIGVNLFILISGYFGIKSVKRSLSRILISFLWCAILVSFILKFKTLFYFNFLHWWFIENFVVLILLSPIIEKSLDGISFKRLSYWILLLTLVNVVFGWVIGLINNNGYNFVNFVYLYYLGRWVKALMSTKFFSNIVLVKIGMLALFVMNSLVYMLVYSKYIQYTSVTSIKWWSYNSPAIILSSICVFILFATFSFKSKVINFIASGSLAAYILHTKDFFYQIVMHRITEVFDLYSYGGIFVFVICILFGLYLVCAPVEYILGHFIKLLPSLFAKKK